VREISGTRTMAAGPEPERLRSRAGKSPSSTGRDAVDEERGKRFE